ncbi:hypothetical protein OS242_14875 [Tumebacillus sp. DT12]|uniref:DUF5050 domain-containing protein n=1 Tax=Tumebacillus lacus TaxID=2995335 RepID=A0ABT3X2W1_9BACL|nr:hypothetical protein [Tumebacillus lacus]MCX7571233.1 hypothetical protein [Tumebacillus lacus]
MSDRLPVPESLEQAFEASKYSPSDYELAQKRARGWEKLMRQAKRKRRFGRRMPMAGVLASAAVAALILVPNWGGSVKEGAPSDGSQQGLPSLSQPEQEEGKDAVGAPQQDVVNEYYVREMKDKLYREQGYELVYYHPELSYDVVRDGDAFYLARDGEEKHRLFDAPTRDINLVEVQDTYLVFQYIGAVQYEEQKPVWLVNAEDLSVKELMLEGNWSSGLTIWEEQGRSALIYLGYNSGSKEQMVYSYDLQSGESRVILANQDMMFNKVSSVGGQLTISNWYKVLLRSGDEWRTVAQSESGGVEIVMQSRDQILYATGAGLNGIEPGPGTYNNGSMKLYRYDLATGQNKPMLPGVEGNQTLVMDLQSEGLQEFVISSFVMEPGEQPGTDSRGTVTLWRVAIGEEPKQIFQKQGVLYRDSLLLRQTFAEGVVEKDIYIGTRTNQKWQLRYHVPNGTVEEVTPYSENP